MSLCFVDVETRSRVDLKQSGSSRYARDESTEVLCVAYVAYERGGKNTTMLWTPSTGAPCPAEIAEAGTLVAHNATFECDIFKHILTPQFGWPEFPACRWLCTAARVAALGLPRSLQNAGAALGLAVQKDKEGKALIKQLCTPRKPTEKDPREWDEDPEKYGKLYAYCRQDVLAEIAVYEATQDAGGYEREIWLLDQEINERGIPLDTRSIKTALQVVTLNDQALRGKLKEITQGAVDSPGQINAIERWLKKQGHPLPNLQAATVSEALAREDLPLDVRRVIEIRQLAARSSIKKLERMRASVDSDGRVRGSHMYYGAHTGRWTGAGVQFQNLPRGTLSTGEVLDVFQHLAWGTQEVLKVYDDSAAVLSGSMRGMIKAKPGRRLIVCDFAQIETAVLAWLANETEVLEALAMGDDVYVQLAAKIYGKAPEEVTKDERMLGKVATLGLGYQMGAEAFVRSAANWGITITLEQSQKVVDVYRRERWRTVKFWRTLQDAAFDAVKNRKHLVIEGKGVAPTLLFWCIKNTRYLQVRLPSGRRIFYPEAWAETVWEGKVKRRQFSYHAFVDNAWKSVDSYGGKLTENVVSGVGRDLLAEAMLRLADEGYSIVMHVHDEVVCEEPEGLGDVLEVERIMSIRPSWATHCPISAEGFECLRYRK
jgi:DNA polymerase